MRTISAVTVGRSDWGIYRPVLETIRRDSDLRLHLIAASSHLVHGHGCTLTEIERDGFQPDDQVDMLLASDRPVSIATSMGLGTIGFAQILQRVRPDILLVLGDRFEMHSAAVAATPFRIPIAHIHGGEVTEGAIDDAYRHAITKYSHLHFVSNAEHAHRVIQLGEEPWRVTISGAPALDNLADLKLMDRDELSALVGIPLDESPLLVTMHPVTLQFEDAGTQILQLLAALDGFTQPIIMTRPNADTHHSEILQQMEAFAQSHKNVRLVANLGTRAYFSLMKIAAAMAGNSSSGIIEAASFQLPVVNIGLRQQGRPRSGNVVDVQCGSDLIREAIQQATSIDFRRHVRQFANIYGDGHAAVRIVNVLKQQPLDSKLLIKHFYDIPPVGRPSDQIAA